jgi:hypothetical protein
MLKSDPPTTYLTSDDGSAEQWNTTPIDGDETESSTFPFVMIWHNRS